MYVRSIDIDLYALPGLLAAGELVVGGGVEVLTRLLIHVLHRQGDLLTRRYTQHFHLDTLELAQVLVTSYTWPCISVTL